MPLGQNLGVFVVVWFFMAFYQPVYAETIASQTQGYNHQLNTWQAVQELGDNLSGILDKFTFRIRTLKPHQDQFHFTAENSRIFDKTTNTTLLSCLPAGSNPQDTLRGLTFNSEGVPGGYEDVTLDFSCHNYNFIPDHKYLIKISSGDPIIFIPFAGVSYGAGNPQNNDFFNKGGLRYANGNPFDRANNSGSCDASTYTWNGTNPWRNGCFVWTNPKDDLYFILSNNSPPPPPPKLPVIFIPGIGGSELKASQDIFWSFDNGHHGTYSHAYAGDEKVWVNQDEAAKLGDDDYFDVLRLKSDGQTSEAALSLTGSLTQSGYGEIDPFFIGMGYEKGKNFFVFPYDWRKDIRTTKDSLDSLIEEAKTKSGQSKVNIVAHSMGGLIARYYISDSDKASKVNKLIELGVPHLGAVDDMKALVYGLPLGKPVLKFFNIGISGSEVKDIFQNLPSAFQLLPSRLYFDFYDNSTENQSSPFHDERDIDNNKVKGVLNFDQMKTLLSNLGHNMAVFKFAEELQDSIKLLFEKNNSVKLYNIVGSNQPTLGQIHETWWITWPVTLIPKRDEIYINGDGVIPLYSASLKNSSKDFSAGAAIYYTEQEHVDLVNKNGTAMQTVKAILNGDSLPIEVKSEKIYLEGHQISLDDGELELFDDEDRHTGIKDNGEIETNIPDTFYSTSSKTKHAFIKKKSKKVKVRITRKNKTTSDPKTTNIKIRKYKEDKVSKTIVYKNIPLSSQTSKIEFELDPLSDNNSSLAFYPDSEKSENNIIDPDSEALGSASLDQNSPTTSIQISGSKDSSGIYTGPVTITLSGNDTESGILRIEYSLDSGQTVQIYTEPFIISAVGKTNVQIKSIDKAGNEEIPMSQTIEIEIPPSPTPAPASSNSSSNSSSSSSSGSSSSASTPEESPSIPPGTSEPTSGVSQSTDLSYSTPSILGISFDNPSHVSDEINTSGILNSDNNQSKSNTLNNFSSSQILKGLLIIVGGITAAASISLIATFLKPSPK